MSDKRKEKFQVGQEVWVRAIVHEIIGGHIEVDLGEGEIVVRAYDSPDLLATGDLLARMNAKRERSW